MSTPKPLPKDLKQLEQKPRFKQFYKQHTVEQLEEKLIDAGVEYGSDENKAALTWRYMDAKGMDFDNQANDKPATDAVLEKPPTEESADHADNKVSTEPTPQADDSKASDTANDSEQPSESAAQSAQPSVNDEGVDNAAKGGDDKAQATPPVSANDNRAPTGNGSEEEQPNAAADQGNHAAGKPAAPVKVKDHREFIEVTNNGAYNFYETATGTMLLARKTTKIYPTATIDKAHILRNIDQYNQTRGKTLHVHN